MKSLDSLFIRQTIHSFMPLFDISCASSRFIPAAPMSLTLKPQALPEGKHLLMHHYR